MSLLSTQLFGLSWFGFIHPRRKGFERSGIECLTQLIPPLQQPPSAQFHIWHNRSPRCNDLELPVSTKPGNVSKLGGRSDLATFGLTAPLSLCKANSSAKILMRICSRGKAERKVTDDMNPASAPDESFDSLDWAILESKYPVTLRDTLFTLPAAPGCYLMKNAGGQIIYVGKAKILKSRVRSYFQKGADLTRRKRQMVYEVADIETIVTDTELEALILESNLIKKHHPTYNVRLRDDKSYPYIAVTLSDEWPRVLYARKLRMQPREKDKYFGPYTDTEAVRETLKLIRRVFRVPCGYKRPEESKGKACMYLPYQSVYGSVRGKDHQG